MDQKTAAPPDEFYTVAEFCKMHRIGETTYYKLRRKGRGPRELHIFGRTVISREAIEEWRQHMATT
jgi:hypothetical protein